MPVNFIRDKMVGAEKSIHAKLSELENEIKGLKLMMTELIGKTKGIVALEGALKGVTVCEEDFEEAKKALFKPGA